MLSSSISRMLNYIFLLLSIIIIFLWFVLQNMPYSGKLYLLGWPQPPGFSLPSLNLSCSHAVTRVSILLSVWMISWSWFALSRQVRGLFHFCVLYWFVLDYILIFPILTFSSIRLLVFFGFCWDTVHVSVSLLHDKLADIQQLALSLLQT